MRCVNCPDFVRDKRMKPEYIGICSRYFRSVGVHPKVSDSLCGCNPDTGELWNFMDTDNYVMKTAPEGVLN